MMCHAHNSARVEAINTTPFEAMMGRAAPSIVDHIVQPTHGQSPSAMDRVASSAAEQRGTCQTESTVR
eukprot:m.619222 g.619222  ORF g.619222 m.619222 type:complete len:68 (-) comp58197_c0_seq2:517-720(-)